jgi:cell division protein FtsN
MILGAIIVTVAVLFFNRSDNPFSQSSSTKPGTPTTVAPQSTGTPATPDDTTAPTAPTVAALPGKPGDRPVEKPDYTFFNTLPSGEPASTPSPVPPPPSAPPVQSPAEKPMYLQLGAFENAQQADDIRVQLVLLGLDRIVTQRTQLADGRVVHRIRIGPFTNREDLKAMRARVVSNGFSPDEVSN